MPPRVPFSLSARLGSSSACKRATGLTESELAVVIACESCLRAHGAHPTREAIRQITGAGHGNTTSRLVQQRVLRRADGGEGPATYAVCEDWRVALGIADAERAAS